MDTTSLPGFRRFDVCNECGANIPRFAVAATNRMHAPTCSRYHGVTVTYKGNLSTVTRQAADFREARIVCLAWVDHYGPDAWRYTFVKDGQGMEHRPSELWGEIPLRAE